MTGVSPARKAAFHILFAVERGSAHADDLLRSDAVNALSANDRNLTTALVLGVLRWQILLDRQLQAFLARPNAKLDAPVRLALRLAAFQLLHMDRIPARAAIDESVELTKQAGHRFAARMVNAVLRKFAANPPAPSVENSPAELALATAHPAWLVERWATNFGIEAARAICLHGQQQPAQTIRLASESDLDAAGIVCKPGHLLTAARTLISGDIAPLLDSGRIRLQDEGSQLIGEIAALVGKNLIPNRGEILDACAAPGGKTLILAERLPQARIVACETTPSRYTALRARLAAYADRIECHLADASELVEDSAFDLALVDAPCSGTGTLGRNPEIRHRLRPEDLPRQAERQRAILKSTLRTIRLGGRLVYSTCSLEPEENEQVVITAFAAVSNATLVPLDTLIRSMRKEEILTNEGTELLLASLTPQGCLRLLPGALHNDGFFVALIERTV